MGLPKISGRYIWILILFSAVACSFAPVLGKKASEQLNDGVYEGTYSSFPNSATVRITVEDKRIAKVELVKHRGSSRGRRANEIIPKRILEEQSTQVDAVSGATNSSRVIMNAAEDAINQALKGASSSVDSAQGN